LCENRDSEEATSSVVLNLAEAPRIDKEFLHKYLTLTRADLFFADKAILIEGTTERIFIPAAIAKFDDADRKAGGSSLASQYVSIMEVGGAYAHIFYPFLDFLGIQTLVITDLDPAKPNPKQLEACCVQEGTVTTNRGIAKWFHRDAISPAELLQYAEDDLPVTGTRALAYQVPEKPGGPCGRTFEDAFILANPHLFDIEDDDAASLLEREKIVRQEAKRYKKSDFALTFAIDEANWEVPYYIKRGLEWLLGRSPEAADDSRDASGQVVVR
jgi:hypothetical protein